ncbi:SGNH/GDSL hydrolase family protein [Luteococcus sp. Sow4_B9]|uniref:SGNH/GDSL hydrolase family protein n=1 Tax=Luteococcus sp. Sow4_B9 TaxID=3438792 RepID=UPI003F96029A
MNPLSALLRPFAVSQGERLLGDLADVALPSDAPHGLAEPPAGAPKAAAHGTERMHLVLLGDATATGAGTQSAAEGLPGTLGRRVAEATGRSVLWQVLAEPGASSLGLHESQVPRVSPAAEAVVVLVGMHDVLARTSPREWEVELDASLGLLAHVPRVVVAGCPPLGRAPRLSWPLTALLEEDCRTLDRVTDRVCTQRGVAFVSLRGLGQDAGDWADDGIHPGLAGQRRLAELLAPAVAKDPPA